MKKLKTGAKRHNIKELQKVAQEIVHEREWGQFHTPKDLSMNLSIESNELMEKFLWMTSKDSFAEISKNRQEIEDELGDIFYSILAFCNAANIDLSAAFLQKVEKIKQKYPVEKAKGNYNKYTKL